MIYKQREIKNLAGYYREALENAYEFNLPFLHLKEYNKAIFSSLPSYQSRYEIPHKQEILELVGQFLCEKERKKLYIGYPIVVYKNYSGPILLQETQNIKFENKIILHLDQPFYNRFFIKILPPGIKDILSSKPVFDWKKIIDMLKNLGFEIGETENIENDKTVYKICAIFTAPKVHTFLAQELKYIENTEWISKDEKNSTLNVPYENPVFPLIHDEDEKEILKMIAESPNRLFLISGPPGTGKTTTLINLASHLAFYNKSILIISEKQPALRVIKEKTKNLREVFNYLVNTKESKEEFIKEIEKKKEKKEENIREKLKTLENLKREKERALTYAKKNLFTILELGKEICKTTIGFYHLLKKYKKYEMLQFDNISLYQKKLKKWVKEFILLVKNYKDFKKISSEEKEFFDELIKTNITIEEIKRELSKVPEIDTIKSELVKTDWDALISLQETLSNIKEDLPKKLTILSENKTYEDYEHMLNVIKKIKNQVDKYFSLPIFIRFFLKKRTKKIIASYCYMIFPSDIIEKIIFLLENEDKEEITYLFQILSQEVLMLKIKKMLNSYSISYDERILKVIRNTQWRILIPLLKLNYQLKEIITKSSEIIKSIEEMEENFMIYENFIKVLNTFPPFLLEFIMSILKNEASEFEKIKCFTGSLFLSYFSEKLEERDPEDLVQSIKELESRIRNLKEKLLDVNLNLLKFKIESELLNKEVSQELNVLKKLLKRRGRKIDKFEEIKNHIDWKKLTKVLPVWIMDIESLIKVFPLKPIFDVAFIDEATQMNQALFLSILLRCKKLVVVGDPHQLAHYLEIFFPEQKERNLREKYNIDTLPRGFIFNFKQYSVLDIAEILSDKYELQKHFRSVPELIEWNNRKFYEGRLKTLSLPSENSPFEFVYINDAIEENKVNKKEAEKVVEYLIDYLTKEENPSIGVLSLFRKQAEYIQELFLKKINIQLLKKIQSLKEPPIISTVDSFQGSERDIILFSLRFAPNSSPNIFVLESDYRRINTAFSRARKKYVFFISTKIENFPDGLVKDYLKYALNIIENSKKNLQIKDIFIKELENIVKELGGEIFSITIGDFISEVIKLNNKRFTIFILGRDSYEKFNSLLKCRTEILVLHPFDILIEPQRAKQKILSKAYQKNYAYVV